MTEAQRIKFHRMCDEMDKQSVGTNLGSYDNMCNWLKRDHYSFYLQVKDDLMELWNEVKTIVGNIAEGVLDSIINITASSIEEICKCMHGLEYRVYLCLGKFVHCCKDFFSLFVCHNLYEFKSNLLYSTRKGTRPYIGHLQVLYHLPEQLKV